MKPGKLSFRIAERKDCQLVLEFIKHLAEYEKMSDEVVNDAAMIEEWLFDKKTAEVFFVVVDGKEVGFALFFHNYSTFVGRAGLYVEDVFILPEYRGFGYGKATFVRLAQIAKERNCGRMEWVCLNWNQPSIDFYLSMGAIPMKEWTTYRFTDETISKVAGAQDNVGK